MLISKKINDAINQQIGNEFGASLQYVAIAAHFDEEALPQLAAHFYQQAEEERDHAMRFVKFLVDADGQVVIPAVKAPKHKFASAEEAVKLSLDWEVEVTDQIHKLVALAKKELNYTTDNFLQWFVKEQLEEVSSMDNLLKVIRRAGEEGLLRVEEWLARKARTCLLKEILPETVWPALRLGVAVVLLGAAACKRTAESPASPESFGASRERMVREQIESRGVTDSQVLAAMRKVPRHEFVPERWIDSAYDDGPLPIGYEQTISQPYIVALMTELLQLTPQAKVLEVGTGSGYQAAVLDEIVAEIYSIEIIEPLATTATERLKRLGYGKVHVKLGDGYLGWPEHAPFDAIIVTAGAAHVPPPLVEQLKPGGRMVIPIGEIPGQQSLWLIEKSTDGKVTERHVAPVAFVPLTRSPKE